MKLHQVDQVGVLSAYTTTTTIAREKQKMKYNKKSMEKRPKKKQRRQTKAKIAEAGFAFWLIRLICSRWRLRFPAPSLDSAKHFFIFFFGGTGWRCHWHCLCLRRLKYFTLFFARGRNANWMRDKAIKHAADRHWTVQQTNSCLLFVACLLPNEGGLATYRMSISL